MWIMILFFTVGSHWQITQIEFETEALCRAAEKDMTTDSATGEPNKHITAKCLQIGHGTI